MAAQLSLLATNNNSSRLETFPSCPFVPLRFIVSPLFLFLFFFLFVYTIGTSGNFAKVVEPSGENLYVGGARGEKAVVLQIELACLSEFRSIILHL